MKIEVRKYTKELIQDVIDFEEKAEKERVPNDERQYRNYKFSTKVLEFLQ